MVSFAWKNSEPENETALARVVSVVTGQLRVYATREMKHHFVSRYCHNIRHLIKSLLHQMYRELVHDSSAARTSEIDERVVQALLD